jgi:hypothetical protein
LRVRHDCILAEGWEAPPAPIRAQIPVCPVLTDQLAAGGY